MKARFCIILLLSLFSIQLSAQRYKFNLQEHDVKPYHFGFILGVNSMDFSVKPNTNNYGISYTPDKHNITDSNLDFLGVHSKPTVGFTVGIVGNYRLGQFTDLRFIPSLAFGERELHYSYINNPISGADHFMDSDIKTINSTYLAFPLHLKYKSKRAKNFRAYVLAGLSLNIDLSATKKDVITDEEFLKLAKNDLLYEVGAGFDFYFPFFKFGIELKGSYGTKELLLSSGNMYADGIQSLKSKLFQISLTFE